MSANESKACETADAAEKEFRQKSQWHSFMGATYSALGVASFFGALGAVADGVISMATGIPSITPGGVPTPAAYLTSGAMPYLAMGGLVATGVASTYMAQNEYTELQCLRDDHMARLNAAAMGKGHAGEIVQAALEVKGKAAEYPQNTRADGKEWAQVVASRADQHGHLASR